jgi:hypothetical protein
LPLCIVVPHGVRERAGTAKHPATVAGCLSIRRPLALPRSEPSVDTAIEPAKCRSAPWRRAAA